MIFLALQPLFLWYWLDNVYKLFFGVFFEYSWFMKIWANYIFVVITDCGADKASSNAHNAKFI